MNGNLLREGPEREVIYVAESEKRIQAPEKM